MSMDWINQEAQIESGMKVSTSTSGLRVRNLLIMLLALFVLRDCLQDEYSYGEEAGYQWGYSDGKDAGTQMCPRPFVRLENGSVTS